MDVCSLRSRVLIFLRSNFYHWVHSFITFAKSSEKLTFLTSWYQGVRKGVRNTSFSQNFANVICEWSLDRHSNRHLSFQSSNGNTGAIIEICYKLAIKTLERRRILYWRLFWPPYWWLWTNFTYFTGAYWLWTSKLHQVICEWGYGWFFPVM